jgi:hypothetical protein
MASMYKVELRDHVGVMNKAGKIVEVRHPQWMVFSCREPDEPRQVGYVGTHEGAKFCPLAGVLDRIGPMLYEELEKAVAEAVAAKKQGPSE